MNKFSTLRQAVLYARDNKFDRNSQFYRPVINAYVSALTKPQDPPPIKKTVKTKIITNKLKCLKCGDIIESKHRHDFNMCSCESIFVDGGTDYMRRGGQLEHMEDLSEVVFLNE